jgi:general secretion pathway protein C
MKSHHILAAVTFLVGVLVGYRAQPPAMAQPPASTEQPAATQASLAPQPAARAASEVPACTGLHQSAPERWTMSRAEAARCLDNRGDLAMQARIMPGFRDGVLQGFRIFSILPGSVYEQLGLKNGDTITSINGSRLDSPEKMLDLYAKLAQADLVEVELERQGQVRHHQYAIQ